VLHRREEEDLVGHIGGDDFIIITNHPNVSEMSTEIIENFDRGIVSFYDEQKMTDVLCDINEKMCRVKDRYGNEVLTNGISISIALLEFSGKKIELLTPEEITRRLGELKKSAKSSIGSSFVREMF
jgi:GGDEF domain-containing protein